jgi:hypothetical protein
MVADPCSLLIRRSLSTSQLVPSALPRGLEAGDWKPLPLPAGFLNPTNLHTSRPKQPEVERTERQDVTHRSFYFPTALHTQDPRPIPPFSAQIKVPVNVADIPRGGVPALDKRVLGRIHPCIQRSPLSVRNKDRDRNFERVIPDSWRLGEQFRH